MRFGVHSWIFFAAALAKPCAANEFFRPQNEQELRFLETNPIAVDEFVRIPGATVAWFNRDALERDFPALAGKSDQELRAWILDNFAYVSRGQLELQGLRIADLVHDPKNAKRGFRPNGWNRAAVLEAKAGDGTALGMVDVKGIGNPTGGAVIAETKQNFAVADGEAADKLRIKDHSDGMMSFGEAIAEVDRQTAEQRLYDLRAAKLGPARGAEQTVESYFVISLPTDILKDKGAKIPAALYGRQAHWGRVSGLTIPDGLAIDPYGGVQGTAFRTRVDFGGVLIQDPRLRAQFGSLSDAETIDAQKGKPWVWGHEVAAAYMKGDTEAVNRHLNEMLAPIDASWKKVPHGQAMFEGTAALARDLRRVQSPEPLTLEEFKSFRANDPLAKVLVVLRASPEKLREMAALAPLTDGHWVAAILKASLERQVPLKAAFFPLLMGRPYPAPPREALAKVAGVPLDKFPSSLPDFVRSFANPQRLPLAEFENALTKSFADMGYAAADIPDPKSPLFTEGRLKASDAFDAAHIDASMKDLKAALTQPTFSKLALNEVLKEHAAAIQAHRFHSPQSCIGAALAEILP